MRTVLMLMLVFTSFALPESARAAGVFEAAAGKVEVTPAHPVYLAGYERDRLSAGVHDPLWARCIVLRRGDQTLALVSCDVLGLLRPDIKRIRALVKRVPPERVVIGATHTHSGPDTYGQWGPNAGTSGVDRAWLNGVCHAIASLVDETAARLKPATVSFATATDIRDCSKNIRVPAILDTELGAMRVADSAGTTIGTLVNYACHPEILDSRLITSDFPYYLRQRLEQRLGGVALYMNGAQGGMVTADIRDESHYPKGEAWPEAERIGQTLADKAADALVGARPVTDPAITFGQTVFRVPLESPVFKAMIGSHVLPADMVVNGQVETEVSRFTVGPAEFLTMPGEVLPNIGLYLKRKMSGSPRFLLGLTGDALGYILTPEDFGLKLYAYESSVSVGPAMGRKMEEALLALMAKRPAANRSRGR